MELTLMKRVQIEKPCNVEEKCPSFLTNTGLELIIFGGKGGVGKTTSAVASAIHIATRIPEKNVLLASIDPAHSLQDSLAGFEGLDNLKTLEINAEKSLERFKGKHQKTLRTIAGRGTFLDNEDISNFLSLSMPGLDEVMGIIDVIEFLKSSGCDMVVLDTAPTGHTLRFLGLPEVIRKWLKALDSMLAKHRYMKMLYTGKYEKDEVDNFLEEMFKDVKGLSRLLHDNVKCEFVPVMVLEKLVIQETVRLLVSLEKYGIQSKNIIINRVYEYSACSLCNSKRLQQEKLFEEAGCVLDKYNLIKVPLYCDEIQGIHALNEYGKNLELIWRNAGDTGKGCGFHVPGYELNIQLATRNPELCAAEGLCITSNLQQSSGIENQESGNGHQALFSSAVDKAQIILVGGKGGVGKTTISCALALQTRCINSSRKILLISTDPAHSLSDCLGINIGEEGKVLYDNLYAMELNAEKEFEYLTNLYSVEIKDMFNSILNGSMIDVKFDKEVMERLLDFSPPGLDEVMALTKIVDYIEEERYDVFILDTAPTGHLIRFLELPELIEDWLKTFFTIFLKYKSILRAPKLKNYLVKISKTIKKLRKILVDTEKTLFLPVSIPTEMALEETKDLICAMRRLGIYYSAIFLNMVVPYSQCNVCAEIERNQEQTVKEYYKVFTKEKVHIVFHCDKGPIGLDELKDLSLKIFK